MHFRAFKSKTHMYRLYCNNNYCVISLLCDLICSSTLEIMHTFINNYDILGQNVGQIRQTSGTKSETTGTIVPVVNMLKYALI